MSKNTKPGTSDTGRKLRKRPSMAEKDQNTPPKSTKFEDIDDIFSHYTSTSEFCIEGKVELNDKASKFFYKTTNGDIQCFDVLNSSKQEIETLASNCARSPFGMGGKSVVDAKIREAKELRAKDFAFQFNPQMKSSIVSQIKKLLGGKEFVIEPYKLNIYPEGGHFTRHKDTIKNEKMIASLVICLPIRFKGGVLTVENSRKKSVKFDWGQEITSESNEIQWACFFCSCDHFISKVTKGNRITVSYDIFTDVSKQQSSDDKESIPEISHDQCIENLQNFVKELDVKKIYGYFPNHVYGLSDTFDKKVDLRDKLKGNDLLLYDILKEQGWKSVLEVYYPDLKSYGPYVDFFDADDYDMDIKLEDFIEEGEKEKLSKLSSLKLLNKENSGEKEELFCTGNSPHRVWKSFYASTIMVLRHQTTSEEK